MRVRVSRSLMMILILMYCLSFLPTFIYSVFNNNRSLQTLRTSYQNLYDYECEMLLSEMLDDIDTMQTQIYQLMNDSNLLRYIYFDASSSSKYERSSSALRLLYEVESIVSGSDYASDLTLLLPALNEMMSARDGIQPLDSALLDRVMGALQTPDGVISYSAQTISIIHSSRSSTMVDGRQLPTVLLLSELSVPRISGWLHTATSNISAASNFILYGEQQPLITRADQSMTFNTATLLSYLDDALPEKRGTSLMLDDQACFVSHAHANPYGLRLVEIVPESAVPSFMEGYALSQKILFLFMLLSILFFFFFMTYYLYHPIRALLRAFSQAENGHVEEFDYKATSREFQAIFSGFNRMVKRLNQHIRDHYRLRLLASDAERRQLQYQINPHFLYNSFFMLRAFLEEENYEQSIRTTEFLGEYFQYITYNQEQCATLAQELKHAFSYAEIQQMRYAKTLHIELPEIQPACQSIHVPRLILQPLIENAILHGIDLKHRGQIIRVTVTADPHHPCICVENTGSALSDEELERIRDLIQNEASGSIALYNINKRLRLTYGESSGLFAGRSESLGGLKMTIVMEDTHYVENIDR